MPHAQLRMILSQRGIASVMQPILNAPMGTSQGKQSPGISQRSWQAGDSIAHLCFGGAKGISPLIFEFEDLSQFWPGTVVCQHATNGDCSLFQTPVPFH